MHLLDVNALIALVDPLHVHHRKVSHWFLNSHLEGWATCPITENGFVRILGHLNYPNGSGSTDSTRKLLIRLCMHPGHQFWPDTISIREENGSSLPHLTDCYLLALAISRNAKLATLDVRIDPKMLYGGHEAFLLIE